MVAVMILAFLIAWMPYSVLALLIAFGGVRISPAVSIIPALCAKSSICWNPIIYIGLNTQVLLCYMIYSIFHYVISVYSLHYIRLFCNMTVVAYPYGTKFITKIPSSLITHLSLRDPKVFAENLFR